MALSVVKRPESHLIFNGTLVGGAGAASVTDSSGDANISYTGHGLVTGNSIYAIADILEYCGEWYVVRIDNNNFKIRQYATASNEQFVGTCYITWYQLNTACEWSSAHLPIQYKLTSNLWPTNSADTIRTVSSIANDNGYVQLTLSGALHATVNDLEWVQVFAQNAGIYQILTAYSTSVVTINFPYVTGLTFAGSTVQYYYQNYHARVRIYAGLPASHYFTDLNPYELVSELKLVPDSTGVVNVFVNEDIKKKLEILQNKMFYAFITSAVSVIPDLPQWCMFYITYAESFDDSDGYTLGSNVGSYTDDSSSFEGFAINAMLPFGNRYGGFMNDYLGDGLHLRRFLTPMASPLVYPGQYLDISVIIDETTAATVTAHLITKYYNSSGTLLATGTNQIMGAAGYPHGVYRVPILTDNGSTLNSTCARIDAYVVTDLAGAGTILTETKSYEYVTQCSSRTTDKYVDLGWLNHLGGFDYWRFFAYSDWGVDVQETTEAMKNIVDEWDKSWGEFADTVRHETKRDSVQTILLRAENLTSAQVNDIKWVLSSPLVQMIGSRGDVPSIGNPGNPRKKTVIPETGTFDYYPESEKLFTLSFKVSLTNKIPSQSA